ncbi:PD40 domain-containing protein [Streptacidiphilus carbonis]|uniref:PD40 domain-containing protein n=1 Tax=Streptacidiphilus carbonis TaxID=105422 RepID=UPI0005AA7E5C|nr:PD40 domain-containing protein [Streptacidiphilus carbonis]
MNTFRTAAVGLTAAITGGALLLTGCASTTRASVAAGAGSSSAPASGAPSSPPSASSPSSAPSPSAPSPSASTGSSSGAAPGGAPAVPVRNGTAGNRLTISNGTTKVVMNGTVVDFGTVVRDLAWSPDGSRAAFIDGAGNLDTANADGSGRVMVARAPSGENWSHPVWRVAAPDSSVGSPGVDEILFAASQGGKTVLKQVAPAGGAPELLTIPLTDDFGPGGNPLPQTGNTWPTTGGRAGTVLYANGGTGDVYIRDDNIRTAAAKLTIGSEPAISADGGTAVFVRSVNGHDHLFEESVQGNRVARDITPNATTDYTEPTWSPDGRTIAARTPAGIATLPADGSAAPTLVSSAAGLPAYRG